MVDYAEKVQHLQRCSPHTTPQPRVVCAIARQPWAIKGTTLTALRRYNIDNGGYIHWNISAFCYLFIRILTSIIS